MPRQAVLAALQPERALAASPTPRPASGLDEEKLSFLRMVGHELRTPLNSIIGFSEIIERELYGPVGEPRYREHAEIVRESGQKLLRLVDQVMEMARLDAGLAHLDLRPELLEPIIAEAERVVAADAAARHIRLVTTIAADTPCAIVDARALRTVLANLLQNAVNASPSGGEVRLDVAADGEDVMIRVKDHGKGVEPAQIPRLMRPFEQGENPLTRRVEGAGLGLAIVKLLCSAMDGRVRLRSRPGEGLTAYVQLPAAPEDTGPDA